MTLDKLKELIISTQRLQVEANSLDLADPRLGDLIERRDASEEAVNDAVTKILGHPPEWSNRYDYSDAYADCEIEISGFEAATPPTKERIT